MTVVHQAKMLALVTVLLLTGCGEAAGPVEVTLGAAAQSGEEPGGEHAYTQAGGTPQQGTTRHASGLESVLIEPTNATELRITLERLLGQHATLMVRFMRARVDGSESFARVAVDAVVTNTGQLTEVLESVYGSEGGAAFEELWSDHVTSLFDYTVALVEDDAEAMRAATADLDRYVEEFATFVESASEGEVSAGDVAAGLESHIEHLLAQIEAYTAGDYATAFTLQREAYAHMFPTGSELAEGIATQHPGEFPVPVDDAPQQLRSALGLLLGDHVELVIDAMRAGVRGAAQFEHAAATLNDNTEELTEAMEALFGPDDAVRFNTLWADHVDAFVQYTTGLAAGDQDATQVALDQLDMFHHELGQHLSNMTGGELPADVAAEVLRVHDEQLVEQVEVYAAEDYEAAYQISFDAYQHVFDAAAALADAIEAHVGPQLPVGGAATGGGGTAVDGER